MGGINIHCNSFSGDDKSGSALDAVLGGMEEMAPPAERSKIARIITSRSNALDHILIGAPDARVFLPILREYADRIDRQLTIPGDPFDQMMRDDDPARTSEVQYGEGVGWRAYCARDLLRAFEVADRTSEPVVLVWC